MIGFHLYFSIEFFFFFSLKKTNNILFLFTRLDRLLSLLSTGDSLAVKRSAATQIGQVVSTHSKEVELILTKVNKKENELFDKRISFYLS
jgi:hypothetical protein